MFCRRRRCRGNGVSADGPGNENGRVPQVAGPGDALRAGHARGRDLPDGTDEQFGGLVASRQLLLANSLLSSSTASLRADALDYLDVTVEPATVLWRAPLPSLIPVAIHFTSVTPVEARV